MYAITHEQNEEKYTNSANIKLGTIFLLIFHYAL